MRQRRVAYGMYAANDIYAYATAVVHDTLIDICPKMHSPEFVAIVSTSVIQRALRVLHTRHFTISRKEAPVISQNPIYTHSFMKLLFFNMTWFDRIVYLDADSLPMQCMHELFALPDAPLAAPVADWLPTHTLTDALMVIEPRRSIFSQLVRLAATDPKVADMDIINRFFEYKTGGGRNKIYPTVITLPSDYLTLNSELIQKPQAFHSRDDIAKTVKLLHFTAGGKPWNPHLNTSSEDPHWLWRKSYQDFRIRLTRVLEEAYKKHRKK